jgi:hypothetical protein
MAELSSPAAVLEIGTAAPWERKCSSRWVRGPLWDGFWILSALWLAPIVLWLAHGYSNQESSPLDLLYFGLTALFWIGHRLSSIANTFGGVGSNDWDRSPISAQIECAAMGGRALPHVVVARVPPCFRGGSKSRNRNLLRGPDLRFARDTTANLNVAACVASTGLRDGIHSLFARSKRLSNVGSASTRGSIWPDWQISLRIRAAAEWIRRLEGELARYGRWYKSPEKFRTRPRIQQSVTQES